MSARAESIGDACGRHLFRARCEPRDGRRCRHALGVMRPPSARLCKGSQLLRVTERHDCHESPDRARRNAAVAIVPRRPESLDSAVAWYIGTSTSVAASQIDEWSVWIHEIGHAQNISHQSVDSHPYIQEGGTHDHTMRAWTWNGNTDKRNSTYGLRQHERVHACKPYELSHRDITCGSL